MVPFGLPLTDYGPVNSRERFKHRSLFYVQNSLETHQLPGVLGQGGREELGSLSVVRLSITLGSGQFWTGQGGREELGSLSSFLSGERVREQSGCRCVLLSRA